MKKTTLKDHQRRHLFHFNVNSMISPEILELKNDYVQIKDFVTYRGPFMFSFPFFKENFCRDLIWISNMIDRYSSVGGDYFPGTEIELKNLSIYIQEVIDEAVLKFVIPVIYTTYAGIRIREADVFVSKQTVTSRPKNLNVHFDDNSEVSMRIRLNSNYKEGGITFPDYGFNSTDVPVGHVLLFPGKITHAHSFIPVKAGKAYDLVIRGRTTREE